MRPEGPPTASGPMGSGPTGEIDDVDVELAGGPKPTDLVFINSVDPVTAVYLKAACDRDRVAVVAGRYGLRRDCRGEDTQGSQRTRGALGHAR